jgi:tripartite-type tricarboxylate transporter receptor subunit TctC
MRIQRSLFTLGLISALSIGAVTQGPKADSYPSRSVKIIVPYPPGGATDPMARLIAQKLSEMLGSNFYVENLPGAAGTIGTGAAARAPADGYTLLVVNADFIVQSIVKSKVPYDPLTSFDPVSMVVTAPETVLVHPSVPAKDMKELVALLKANPGKFNYATPGYGSTPHLAGERLFRLTHDLEVVHVPFQGGGPAVMSTVAGHTSILLLTLPAVGPLVKEGKLRAIAVQSGNRSTSFPDVPTLAEAGIPDHEVEFMIGVLTPAGTPRTIVELLHQQITRMLRLPDVQERLNALALEAVGGTPDEFAAKIKVELARWRQVVQALGLKID